MANKSLTPSNSDKARNPLAPSIMNAWNGALLMLAICASPIIAAPGQPVATAYYLQQDIWILGLLAILLVAVPRLRTDRFALPDVQLEMKHIIVAAAVSALLLWLGTYLIMANYPLTRDEHMVVFDMAIFRSGHLAMPLDPYWRPYAEALVPNFLLDVPGSQALVSAYMPGNATIRTAFSWFADPALMNPMLAGIGGIGLFFIARRLFGDDRKVIVVVMLLYVTSAQVLANAMTDYAMTAHLALNLCWLALYLRGGRIGHGGAIALGFVGIGLHQVIFHPLFVAPFLAIALWQRRWLLTLVYSAAYTAFGIFWLLYPSLVIASVGVATTHGSTAGASGFIAERVMPLLLTRDPWTIQLMGYNLTRFIAWQNLALLPLLVASFALFRRAEGLVLPLGAGIAGAIIVFGLLLPYQGHGWGYRYLHGFLGSAVLLAGYGYQRLARIDRNGADSLVAALTIASVAISGPFLLWRAHEFVAPYARVNSWIGTLKTDFVVIDTEPVAFAIDEVRNSPDLKERPIRLSSRELKAADIKSICKRGSIMFVSRKQMQMLGLGSEHDAGDVRFQSLQVAAEMPDCVRSRI